MRRECTLRLVEALLVFALLGWAVPGQSLAAARPIASASHRSGTVCNSRSPSVFGFCVATLPQFYCCSAAETGWSHIYVDEMVDVRGAVPPLGSGRPDASDAYIVSPSGRRWVLPVDTRGNFAQRITFTEPGTYHMGLDPSGPGSPWSGQGVQPLPFQVAYRAIPQASQTLAAVFPASSQAWGGIRVIAEPVATRADLRVRFVDALGRPAGNQRLWLNQRAITTDAQGYAEIPFISGQRYGLYEIYPGLFVQTYSRVSIRDGALTGLPRYANGYGPDKVAVIEVHGTPMVDVADFLLYGVADIFQSPTQGVPAVAYDPRSGVLALNSLGKDGLDTHTGLFTWHRPAQDGYRLVSAHLHPVVRGGQVYLSLRDLSTMLDLLWSAWAKPLPDGSMLFSTYEVP